MQIILGEEEEKRNCDRSICLFFRHADLQTSQ